MAMAHFDVSLAYDQVVKRAVPGQVARVSHPDTDMPFETLLDLDGNPIAALVSNSQGYVQPFQIQDGPAFVKLSLGSITYYLVDLNAVGASATAAQEAAAAAQLAASLVEAPADDVISLLVGNDASQTATAGDARWLPQAEVDATFAALVGLDGSDTQNAADARYTKRGELEFNVRDFGAVGDGTTDDTAAIQQAVTMAVGTFGQGGTVVFPDSETYIMQGIVTLHSNITVMSPARATIGILPGASATAKFAILSNGSTGYGSGAQNVTIDNLDFKGSFADSRGIGCMAAHHGSNILITRCRFIEAHRYGHVFDLQGCNGVTFRDCQFIGADYSGSTSWLTGEAIQLDYSTRTGGSAMDSTGSYDGLPTVNVVVERCEFLPLTIGATEYPCPNPIGSHFTVADYFVQNITFQNNVVKHPVQDGSSSIRGVMHWVRARDVKILNNEFIGRPDRINRFIATYNLTTTFPLETVNDSGASSVPLAEPAMCHDFTIEGNTFEGFSWSSTLTDLVWLSGYDATYRATGMKVLNNKFKGCYPAGTPGNVGPHLVNLRYLDNVQVNLNEADRCRRIVFYATVSNLTVAQNHVEYDGGGAGSINGVNGDTVKILYNIMDDTPYAVFCGTGSNVRLIGNSATSVTRTGTRMYDLSGVTGYSIKDNEAFSNMSMTYGYQIRGTSTGGLVKDNTSHGVTTPVSLEAGSTATQADNITV